MGKSFWMALVASALAVPAVMAWAGVEPQKESQNAAQEEGAKEPRRAAVRVRTGGEGVGGTVITIDSDGAKGEKETYLGLGLSPVPPVLAAHLPELLSKDQGLMVVQVAEDSPAAEAGLKQHDVLVSLGDQKLYAIEQLTKLVRNEKPGREITFEVVRGGKKETVKVTLGERVAQPATFQFTPSTPNPYNFFMGRPDQANAKVWMQQDSDKSAKSGGRSRSTSMTIQSTDGEKFKAELEYKTDDGETKKWSFEGTRDEIRKELESNDELPKDVRDQLQRSLNLGARTGPAGFNFTIPADGFNFQNLDGAFPQWKAFEEMFEKMQSTMSEEMKEQLRGKFRSLEEPAKKPVIRDQSL